MWNLVMHFSRGHVLETYKSIVELQARIDLIVFKNRDCINFSCYYSEEIK